jgi:hypothetical protein
VPAHGVGVLPLAEADPGGEFALRQTSPTAAELDLLRHHRRHISTTEIAEPHHWPQIEERDLTGEARRSARQGAWPIGFALCGSSRVGVLPGLDVAARDRIPLKVAGEAHTVATTFELM